MTRSLPREVVAAIEERGRAKIPAPRIADEFGVSMSTAQRYAARGRSQSPSAVPPPEIVAPYLDTPRSIATHSNGKTVRLQKHNDGLNATTSYSVSYVECGYQGVPKKTFRLPDLPLGEALTEFARLYRRHIVGAAA